MLVLEVLLVALCGKAYSIGLYLQDESPVRAHLFEMMAIVVYVGSCVCLLCLMAIFITYVSCFR